MALSTQNRKNNSSISQLLNIAPSNKPKNPFVLFNNFSPNTPRSPSQTREELLLNAKLTKNNNCNSNHLLSSSSLSKKTASTAKTLSFRSVMGLTPYQQYEKRREDSFNRLKTKLELSRPFNTQNDNTKNNNSKKTIIVTKENYQRQCSGQATQGNYSNRRITQEELNGISNVLAKQYNLQEEKTMNKRKPLMLKYKRKKTNKTHQMIKLFLSPLHKIKLSYCNSYRDLNQSPIECFSI